VSKISLVAWQPAVIDHQGAELAKGGEGRLGKNGGIFREQGQETKGNRDNSHFHQNKGLLLTNKREEWGEEEEEKKAGAKGSRVGGSGDGVISN